MKDELQGNELSMCMYVERVSMSLLMFDDPVSQNPTKNTQTNSQAPQAIEKRAREC